MINRYVAKPKALSRSRLLPRCLQAGARGHNVEQARETEVCAITVAAAAVTDVLPFQQQTCSDRSNHGWNDRNSGRRSSKSQSASCLPACRPETNETRRDENGENKAREWKGKGSQHSRACLDVRTYAMHAMHAAENERKPRNQSKARKVKTKKNGSTVSSPCTCIPLQSINRSN